MARRAVAGLGSEARLRWLLGLMFLGLALPAALLVRQGFARLELEEFRRQQLLAENVVRSIDSVLTDAIAVENARPVADYQFAVAAESGNPNLIQLSPLSSIAPAGAFPGTIGYFQVDTAGELSTPLLPESELERGALETEQVRMKFAVERQVAEVLEANQLVRLNSAARLDAADSDVSETNVAATDTSGPARQAAPASFSFDEVADSSELRGQIAFDRLADAEAARALASAAAADAADVGAADVDAAESLAAIPVTSFAGEIEPLRFNLLETGHIVLFRNAWRDGQRYVQGLLVDRSALIRQVFVDAMRLPDFGAGTTVAVSIAGQPVSTLGTIVPGLRVDGGLVYAARLSPPLSDFEISFFAGQLDRGPGFSLLAFTSVALVVVLVGGFTTMYRFGMQQLRLAREQQNFVSAISHELKTPLTSIRMYGEMLKSGWADDDKKTAYYDFIVDEGERLSRLIENVLQLARLNNGGLAVEPTAMTVGELFDLLRSKLTTQAERAGFALEIRVPDDTRELGIGVDADALTQVFINLVDNAIKFSAEAARKSIVLAAQRRDSDHALFTVRDFGPGIPPAGLKRLFELFYRPDNELTRTTTGTGIGLALVRQLVTAMGGRVDVRNCEPGAEFRLIFPLERR